MLQKTQQISLSCLLLTGIFTGMNTSYAGEAIYPPEEITCNGTNCKEVNTNIFKIAVPESRGTFVFDYAYATPVFYQNNYVIVYVYHHKDSPHFGQAIETWLKPDVNNTPYHPESRWTKTADEEGDFHCNGTARECGFLFMKKW